MPTADPLVRQLRDASGEALVAVLAFGSRVSGADPGPKSAWDLFVIVRSYDEFYASCRSALGWRRSARTLATLNRILPPSVLHLRQEGGPGAKLFVITERDLERRLDPERCDRFTSVRLMQRVDCVYVRDDGAAKRIDALLRSNRDQQVDRMRPLLRGRFDVDGFCQKLVVASYGTEIRPETSTRALGVYRAQRGSLNALYTEVLHSAARAGMLVENGGRYAYARPAGAVERMRARFRLLLSRVQTTLRWGKHVITFDGWLDYIAAKVERRTGIKVQPTRSERRFPLLLLPKLFRVLRARDTHSGPEARP